MIKAKRKAKYFKLKVSVYLFAAWVSLHFLRIRIWISLNPYSRCKWIYCLLTIPRTPPNLDTSLSMTTFHCVVTSHLMTTYHPMIKSLSKTTSHSMTTFHSMDTSESIISSNNITPFSSGVKFYSRAISILFPHGIAQTPATPYSTATLWQLKINIK